MKQKLKTLTVSIPPELYKKLKKDADKNVCSISFIVRDALKKYYQEYNKKKGGQND